MLLNFQEDTRVDPKALTLTPAILVTVDTFEFSKQIRESKGVARWEDGDPDPRDPCDSDTFSISKVPESSKASTITLMATLTPEIPVTVDTFESPRRCERPKTLTITRMATLPSAIPVTVDIFEFRTSSESRKNDDNYEDGDRDLRESL